MANYFDNPITGYKQYRGKFDGGFIEHGEYSFTTTSTTVSVPTYFSKIVAVMITPQETLGYNETLFADLTIATGTITVSRVANTKYREFHFAIDNGQFASDDLSATPLMIAQSAMTLTAVEVYCGTINTGTPIFDLGDAVDDDEYVESESVTGGDGATIECTIDDSTVAADDVLIAQTTGGTGGTPADWCISLAATEAAGSYTSALTFNYMFVGIY